ncbi:heme exporter protein CcmB [Chloroflexus sp.]|uniref:heme exporter protein CcmB n=1 Tax=Chloroflexus sp. TaxID=1904827 RepID=UPI00262D7294|nr:heme exporter protein CcmB [uncultured Chloroflexus sp.]
MNAIEQESTSLELPAPPPSGISATLRAAWAIFRKDIACELRTRYAINTLLLFAISAATAVSLGVGFLGLRRTEEALLIQSALLWIALLFAALNGLSRSFVYEEEARTLAALRLSASPTAVFLGKFCFNLTLVLALDLVTSVLFIILLRVQVGSPLAFSAMLISGGLALTSATTIIAAIIARASFKGALFAVLAFPLLVAPLIVAIQGTAQSLENVAIEAVFGPIRFLLAYVTVTFTASLILFPFVWEA